MLSELEIGSFHIAILKEYWDQEGIQGNSLSHGGTTVGFHRGTVDGYEELWTASQTYNLAL